MTIQLFGTASESIVDGPGLRYAIFTQGCPHHCPGCHNPESHDPAGGHARDTGDIIAEWARNSLLRGITLSGGEPFAQSEACLALARAAHAQGLDVWAFSGFLLEDLLASGDDAVQALLREIDVLVDGRFEQALFSHELRFRGSSNQRILDIKESLAQGKAVLFNLPD